MASIDPARRAAAALLSGVLQERLTLAEQAGELAALAPSDRARAQRIALATLRNLTRADAMLKPHLRKAPPPDLHVLLRLGTVEICALGEAPHGVTDALVTLARSGGQKTEGFAGLINAVLRKIASDTDRWARLDAPALPGWLRGRLMSAYGKVAVMRMEAAHLAGAATDLSVKADAAGWAGKLGAELLPTGSLRLAQAGQITELPGYATGDWWVQDAAAALPARVLNAQPGEHVLDLCAAPGGKTLQLLAAGARVTALDVSAPRLDRLEENLARCGMRAETVVADALDWVPAAPFDAILLDAPCSATGTIRRHPDLPFVKDASGIKTLVALQAALLDRALGWLKPGGRMIYATCSLLPEEGEAQIAAALTRHPGLQILPATAPGLDPDWRTEHGCLRLRPDFWPDRGGLDGFFIAVLRRDG